jgi:hypothetical protein
MKKCEKMSLTFLSEFSLWELGVSECFKILEQRTWGSKLVQIESFDIVAKVLNNRPSK